MSVPKFLTLEELIRDHERLCAEVEQLKKEFESHGHDYAASSTSLIIRHTRLPEPPERTFDKNFICKICGADGRSPDVAICHFSLNGRVMTGHTAR
jgi:hypothetical protein